MQMKKKKIDEKEAIEQVHVILKGHPELISALDDFVSLKNSVPKVKTEEAGRPKRKMAGKRQEREAKPPIANKKKKKKKGQAQPKEESSEAPLPPDAMGSWTTVCVGRRVGVWWEKDKTFYFGKILKFQKETGKHRILYDDGKREWENLESERLCWMNGVGWDVEVKGHDWNTLLTKKRASSLFI